MEVLDRIEDYILIAANAKNLVNEINQYKSRDVISSIGGENEVLAKINRTKIAEAEEKLKNVQELLKDSKYALLRTVKGSSKEDIATAKDRVSSKIKELESYLSMLRKKIKDAYVNGDKAHMIGDLKKEKEHNGEYRRLYSEIMELNPIIESYGEVVDVLGGQSLESSNEVEPSK